MVVTIEPGFAKEFGIFHLEQGVAIADDGPDGLSSARGNSTNRDAADEEPPSARNKNDAHPARASAWQAARYGPVGEDGEGFRYLSTTELTSSTPRPGTDGSGSKPSLTAGSGLTSPARSGE